MINEKMVKTRIAEILMENDYPVIAQDVKEGFDKPAVFVNVYPAAVSLLSVDLEQVTDQVEIKYISKTETVEECVNAAEELRRIFLYKTLCVKDRKLTVQEIEFDIENNILYCSFEVTYMQGTPVEIDADDTIETLEMGGESYGITPSVD